MRVQFLLLLNLFAFIKLARPIFLLGGILLYWLGIAIAFAQGTSIKLLPAVIGQVMVTAIQLMAQFANEYFDMEGDLLNTHSRTFFSGGSGVLPSGQLKIELALFAAYFCAAVAVFFIAFTAFGNSLVSAIALLALLGSWFYSAPPLSLVSSGYGEFSTSLIVGLLVPLTGYILQAQRFDMPVLFICLPLMLIHWAMLIAFELPDYEADKAVGKRTQTVRLGLQGAFILHTLLLIGSFIGILISIMTFGVFAHYLWLALPLIIWQSYSYKLSLKCLGDRIKSHVLTTGAVGLFALISVLWLFGFVHAIVF